MSYEVLEWTMPMYSIGTSGYIIIFSIPTNSWICVYYEFYRKNDEMNQQAGSSRAPATGGQISPPGATVGVDQQQQLQQQQQQYYNQQQHSSSSSSNNSSNTSDPEAAEWAAVVTLCWAMTLSAATACAA